VAVAEQVVIELLQDLLCLLDHQSQLLLAPAAMEAQTTLSRVLTDQILCLVQLLLLAAVAVVQTLWLATPTDKQAAPVAAAQVATQPALVAQEIPPVQHRHKEIMVV
jgi:hypothetical protein